MAEFPVNPQRVDPYENCRFRVKWDGVYVPAVTRISPLSRVTQVVPHIDGGSTGAVNLQPGESAYQPITIERGLTQDRTFEKWANLVFNRDAGLGSAQSTNEMRKDIYLELYDEAGQVVMAYKIYRCWPSEYQALPQLDAASTADAIERLVLQTEGWERDTAVTEPVQP